MAEVRISDIVDPTIFTTRVQQLTTEKVAFFGAAFTASEQLTSFLQGGGSNVDVHSFTDLDSTNDVENISSDVSADKSSPFKISSQTENAVRLSRNASWSTMDLARDLSGIGDPADVIANRVASYWARRIQKLGLAVTSGVLASSVTNNSDDLSLDISAAAFSAGVTSISAASIIDALSGLGDNADVAETIVMHSIPCFTLQKLGLIENNVVPGTDQVIKTLLGRTVVVDDSMPKNGGVYETLLLGKGAFQYGMASPTTPTEVIRDPSAGNGGGQETLFSRQELCLHPTGHAFTGSSNPSNAVMADEASWSRVYAERKAIKIVRLISREHA